jgi:1,4-dihydroxy-2-naphthoate octaprenyltransferase
MVSASTTAPTAVRSWIIAFRLPTLWAAVVPVTVGSAAAIDGGHFRPAVFALALAVSLLIQIGTNLANDVFDFERGADAGDRLGPPRATQLGWLTSSQVRTGMLASFGAAAVLGLGLIYWGGWPIAVAGVLSIAAGVAYTGGPWPTGYHGLGEVLVFCFFGFVGVTGTYYLHTDAVAGAALLASVPVGLLITAILVVNNLRDREGDERSGKGTLAVRLGDRLTRAEYALLVAASYVIVLAAALANDLRLLLPMLSLPAAVAVMRPVLSGVRGGALNMTLKRTAQLQLVFGLLLAIGFLV